jgi:hypothetical protein
MTIPVRRRQVVEATEQARALAQIERDLLARLAHGGVE